MHFLKKKKKMDRDSVPCFEKSVVECSLLDNKKMTTATQVLLTTFPNMAKDKELVPLMRRMGIIENLLLANIAKTRDPSTPREDLEGIHANQDVLLADAKNITTQLEAIVRERGMQNSLARINRGMTRLRIRRSEKAASA